MFSCIFFHLAKPNEGRTAMSERSTSVTIHLPFEDTGRVFSQFFSSVRYKDGRTSDLQEAGDMH